jgi:hypothetical protein
MGPQPTHDDEKRQIGAGSVSALNCFLKKAVTAPHKDVAARAKFSAAQ